MIAHFLGTMRTGPDPTNMGASSEGRSRRHMPLQPRSTAKGSIMPPFRYLYKKQHHRRPAHDALNSMAAMPGSWSSPMTRGLVDYLISLNRMYPLPEAPLEQ